MRIGKGFLGGLRREFWKSKQLGLPTSGGIKMLTAQQSIFLYVQKYPYGTVSIAQNRK